MSGIVRQTWLRLTALITAAFLIHLPSLQGDLIWDDYYLVGENPFFRSPIFSWEIFRHYLFLDSSSPHYRPVQNLSYMLDYWVWNGTVYGYHLANILWHAAAGVLVFLLLRQLLPEWTKKAAIDRRIVEMGAWLVALVWVVHPVQSAAVDYISGRADSLAFVFSCGAWLIYLWAFKRKQALPRAAGYTVAATLFLLALCSREIALVWAVLFLTDLFWLQRWKPIRHRVLVLGACCLLLSAYTGLRTLPGKRTVATSSFSWGAAARSGLMLRALGDYSQVTIWPRNLHMERSLLVESMFKSPATNRDQFAFNWLSIAGLLVGAALIVGACRRSPGHRLRAFGAIWFGVGFLPISNLTNLNATSAEHWLYLPLVGLLLVALGWLIELPPRGRFVATVGVLLFAMFLSARSYSRSGDWLNAQTFYERTISAGGWSPRVALNLAVIYGDQGRLKDAEQLLHRTLLNWPDYPQAQSYLSVILQRSGKKDRGDQLLARATAPSPAQKEYPRSWVAALQLARNNINAHQNTEALRVLEAARSTEPNVWPLAKAQADLLQKEGRPEQALQVVEKFAERNWWQYPAYLALGKLKAQLGDGVGAVAALRHACRLDIRETEALNLVTRIEMRAANFPQALAAQERAVSRQPDKPSQYMLYSEVLMEMGRTEQARKALETAKRLKEDASA